MSQFKKLRKSLSILSLSLILTSCSSSTPVKYPTDYSDKVFDNSRFDGTDSNPIYGNDLKHYYDSVISSKSDIYKDTLNQILLDISKYAYNNDGTKGSDVTHILNDYNPSRSVYKNGVATGEYDNLLTRAKESMLDSVTSNTSYINNNLFYESKFVAAQQLEYTLGTNFSEDGVHADGLLVTPTTTFEQAFGANYTTYIENTYYDDLRLQYLTADYIYNKSYASIGNSLARKVQVVQLTDRTDNPGAAKRLLTEYVKDYISGKDSTHPELLGTDPEFEILSRMWRGISKEFVQSLENGSYVDRYQESTYLTSDEISWLTEKKLMSSSSSDLLLGKVMTDKKNLDKMKLDSADNEDPYSNIDSSLESTYTNSYAYSVDTGIRNKIDEYAQYTYVTKGVFPSSASVNGIPTTLKNNIFSVNLALDKATVDKMKNKQDKDGNAVDDYQSIDGVSIFQADGNRYLINNGSVSSDDNQIIYYDSDSKSYFLVRILDGVSNTALNVNSTTSMYETKEVKEQIAREVAFELASDDTYKKEATIYYLRRSNIEFSDDDFLEYLKSNYKDLFKASSNYDDEPKLAFNN